MSKEITARGRDSITVMIKALIRSCSESIVNSFSFQVQLPEVHLDTVRCSTCNEVVGERVTKVVTPDGAES